MKIYFIILAFILSSCGTGSLTLNKEVYIANIDNNISDLKREKVDLTSPNYFSNDFWNYFHPNTTNNIDFIKLKDTSYKIGLLDYGVLASIKINLPKTANGIEKDDKLISSNFSKVLAVPELTKSIEEEYEIFLQLINNKNNAPVFLYRKSFLELIQKLYN